MSCTLRSTTRDSSLLAAITQHVYQSEEKLEFNRSCPLFSEIFGKIQLSDQVQYNSKLYGFSAVKVKLVDYPV